MGLFEGTRYFLANSLPPHRQEQLEYALSKNGAMKADRLTTATHIITNSVHYEGCEDIQDGVVVVSDHWVDRSLVLGKIQPPQYYSADPAMLFSGIVACATELPTADLEVLSAGISALGGQWRTGLTNDVTHLFAVSQSSHRYTTAFSLRESTDIKILLPHWFDDSVKLGIRNLPIDSYLWPDPPYLTQNGIQRPSVPAGEEEGPENKAKKNLLVTANMFTPAADSEVSLPKGVDLLQVKKNVWNGKKILLSWTLSLYGSRREAVEAGVRRAGGEILRYPGDSDDDLGTPEKEKRRDKQEARAIAECDVLVTRWRNGRAYGNAFRLHRTIGTLAWLYYVQSTGLTPRPVDQLLHYPIPRRQIDNFNAHEITVTNYTGEAREYIKRLITAMGATFTPSMTGRNTVLIAAYIHGIKAEKARAWSIPVVNHTWLEDCFIQWRHLTPATEKYIIFPEGVDFSKLLGERGVGVRGIELCDDEEAKEGESSEEEGMDIDLNKVVGGLKPEVDVVEVDHDDDEVLKKDVEEDIDMISMPDTDDPGRDFTFNNDARTSPKKSPTKSTGKNRSIRGISESVSPTKQFRGSVYVSPSKRDSSTMNITPAKSKSSSPAKRRRIIDDDDDKAKEVDVVQRKEHVEEQRDDDGGEEAVSMKRKATRVRGFAPTGVDEEGEIQLATPSKRFKRKSLISGSAVSSTKERGRKAAEAGPDLELSDDVNELDLTPEFFKSSAKPTSNSVKSTSAGAKKRGDDEEESEVERKTAKGKGREGEGEGSEDEVCVTASTKKSPTKKSLSSRRIVLDEDDPLPTLSPKKKLVRRLTSETSLQLAEDKEKARQSESITAPRKLLRRASGRAIPYVEVEAPKEKRRRPGEDEKENVAESNPAKDIANDKADASKTSLLKTTRGDARTRVKAKSAGAKARELYSDSENEISGIAEPKTTKARAKSKGKTKAQEEIKSKPKPKPRYGRKSNKLESSSEGDMPVESEDDGNEENNHRTTLKKKPISVANLKPTPQTSSPLQKVSVVVNPPPVSHSSTKKKSRNKTVDVESDVSQEEDEAQVEPVLSRARRLEKTESVHVVANEKATPYTSRSKTISSPIKNAPITASTSSPKPKPKSKFTAQKPLTSTSKPAQASSPSPPISTASTPNTNISEPPAKRGAAAKAEEKLKVMMPDATEFEREMRKVRKSGGSNLKGINIGAWERAEKEKDIASGLTNERRKRSSDEVEEVSDRGAERKRRRWSSVKVKEEKAEERNGDDETEEVVLVSKAKGKGKQRESELVTIPNGIYLMTTQVTLPDNIVKALEKLGVSMTSKPSQCTHLIATHLVRTEKFLCAIAAAPHILELSWATASVAAKQLLPEDKYLLRDEAAETKYSMKLSEALGRAKELKGKLFSQKAFYITSKTKVDIKLLKSVVTAHGGQLLQQPLTVRMINGNSNRHVISCPEDISIWRPLAAHNIPIYTHEFLLIGVLKQELEWDNPIFQVDGSR